MKTGYPGCGIGDAATVVVGDKLYCIGKDDISMRSKSSAEAAL
jgi:hypothetical protein